MTLSADTPPLSASGDITVAAGTHVFEIYEASTGNQLGQVTATLNSGVAYSLIAQGYLSGTPSIQLVALADMPTLGKAQLVNALTSNQPLDLLTGGLTAFQNVTYTGSSPYRDFNVDAFNVQLTPAGISTTVLFNGTFPLQPNADHTLVALGDITTTETILLADDNSLPALGQARVRFVHASPDAPAVDVAVQGGATLFSNVVYKGTGQYVSVAAGTVTLEVRDYATTHVLATLPDVQFHEGYIYTLYLMGLNSGSPALQLVLNTDVVTTLAVKSTYYVDQPQAGMWGMKLNGDITSSDQYGLSISGIHPEPTLSAMSAGISGTTALTTSGS